MRTKYKKRPSMTGVRDTMAALGFGPCSMFLGVVESEEPENVEGRDIILQVELVPEDLTIPCRLACNAGSDDAGVWKIPPAGSEVMVAIPSGELDNGGVIVATLGNPPAEVTDTTTIVVKAAKVIVVSDDVRLGSDSASIKVALKSDLDALKTWVDTHTHLTTATVSTGLAGAIAVPTQAPSPSPVGANKVKAE